jgi:mannose-6-phosphate isomerase-like protein (cupin superfamily)
MSGFSVNIEAATLANPNFRTVLYTAPHSQLVVMTIEPGGEIGLERHEGRDQFIRVEAGAGEAILDGERHPLSEGSAVVIPSGTEHNVVNTSTTEALRLYTVYSPAEHPDGTVHRTKADADAAELAHHR